MATRAYYRPGQVIPLAWILVLAAACNMPGLGKDSNYASQSQPLTSGGNQGAGAVPGYGAGERLAYDHNINFNWSGGTTTVRMQIMVKGTVPLQATQNAIGPWECKGRTLDGMFEQMTGSGTIPIQASADWSNSDKSCSCSLADSLEVDVLGKTFYEWRPQDIDCPMRMIALQLKENWYTKHAWSCVCDDPDDAIDAETNMAMFPAVGNPELEKKTMIFSAGCPAESTLESNLADPTGTGSGTYRWSFYPGVNEPQDPGRRVNQPDPRAQDPSQWENEEPIVGFGTCAGGRWGPPIESIVQPVSEWNPTGK